MFACTYFDCTLLQQDTCKFGQVNHKIQDQNGHTKVNILFALMIFIIWYMIPLHTLGLKIKQSLPYNRIMTLRVL